eukprot:6176748-Pleurochrysis_carterae.AAC.4
MQHQHHRQRKQVGNTCMKHSRFYQGASMRNLARALPIKRTAPRGPFPRMDEWPTILENKWFPTWGPTYI